MLAALTLSSSWVQAASAASAASAEPTQTSSASGTIEDQLKFKAGDENGNDIKALKTELLVMKSEKVALAQLERLERRYHNTRMEPEILLRLAEMHMRRARSQRFFEVHRNSENVYTFVPELVKAASEKADIAQAIATYKQLIERHPRYYLIDVALFNSAYASQQLGDDAAAEVFLTKLLKEHRASTLVPDAYLTLGELAYAHRDFKQALEQFHHIRDFPSARVYPYSRYKAGWACYNLQDASQGLSELEAVVEFGKTLASGQANSKLDLRKEALSDMALFFADARDSKAAFEYFSKQAGDLEPAPYLLRLGELYDRHGKYQDEESVLKSVVEKVRSSSVLAQVYPKLIWTDEKLKQPAQAVSQLKALRDWCHKNQDPILNKECGESLSDAAKKLATQWHSAVKRDLSTELSATQKSLAQNAESAYEIYLAAAGKDDVDWVAVQFSYAELLYATGRFREASAAYARIDAAVRAGEHVAGEPAKMKDAAYSAIVALERANGDHWSDEDEVTLSSLADRYEKSVGANGAYVADVQFKRAFIVYEKKRYDDAAPVFKRIGWSPASETHASAEKIEKAQDLYFDILNIKKDFHNLRDAAKALLARESTNTVSASPEPSASSLKILKIYREAYFAEVQSFEDQGNWQKAVAEYKKFALENTSSDLGAKAWWNASQLQARNAQMLESAETCSLMRKHFAQSDKVRDCLVSAAQIFESLAQVQRAALVLIDLADVDSQQRDHWLELASDFYTISGDLPRAIDIHLKLATRSTSLSKRLMPRTRSWAAEHAAITGDHKYVEAVNAVVLKYDIEPLASEALVEKAEAEFKSEQYSEAFAISKHVIAREQASSQAQARARFIQARVLENEYRSQSVKARADRVGLVLALKTEKLEKAQKAYQSAIHYNDNAISVQSLRRLASCYLDYSKVVRAMHIEGDASGAATQALRGELDQLAIPMEEKGVETLNQALETARKTQLHDGQTEAIVADLNRLNFRNPATASNTSGEGSAQQPVKSPVRAPPRYVPQPIGFAQIASGHQQ